MTRHANDFVVRAATPSDDSGVLALVRASLGWSPEQPDEQLFTWKHRDNPAGSSPAWVAVDDDSIVGYRTFMRWEFVNDDGDVVPAVRAVDTATHPNYRGRGIFRLLTLAAIDELKGQGVGLVFNTPNDQSRPGYLKMGWSVVGRLRAGARPSGMRGIGRMGRSRAPAELWSIPTDVGANATSLLQEEGVADALLVHAPKRGFRTRRTSDYLGWRTFLPPLHYRVLMPGDDPRNGAIIFRLRRRGASVELALVEALVPDARTGRLLVKEALSRTGADHVIALSGEQRLGLAPLPRLGPLLTARPLASPVPALNAWNLSLADIELF